MFKERHYKDYNIQIFQYKNSFRYKYFTALIEKSKLHKENYTKRSVTKMSGSSALMLYYCATEIALNQHNFEC